MVQDRSGRAGFGVVLSADRGSGLTLVLWQNGSAADVPTVALLPAEWLAAELVGEHEEEHKLLTRG